MTTQWSFTVTDGRPGGLLVTTEAPYTNVKFVDGLDQGNLTCNLALDAVPPNDRLDLMDIDRTVIWPCRNGTPVGAWIVTSLQPSDLGAGNVSIVAQPALWRVLSGRTVRSTLVFKQVDQLDIARDLIRYACGLSPLYTAPPNPAPKGPGYYVPWIRLGPGLSGVKRDRLDNTDGWQAATRRTVENCLTSLLNVEGSFDIATVAGLDDVRGPYLEVRFGYPDLGRVDPVGVLEWPSGTVTSGTFGADGSDRFSFVEFIGGPDAPNQIIRGATDTAGMVRRMAREAAFTADNVSVPATLTAKAQRALATDGQTRIGFALTTGNTEPAEVYSFNWGDRFRLVLDDVRFPAQSTGAPSEFIVRCRGADITVGGFGQTDTVVLQLEVISGGPWL